jgi:hypothetical protein
MLEGEFRRKVVQTLRPLRAFAIENEIGVGTPDVCCVTGWLELKVASRPVRASSPVRVKRRPTQATWHRMWRMHGGRSWTLTLLDVEHAILHDGYWSATNLGFVNAETLLSHALLISTFPFVTSHGLVSKLREPMMKIELEEGTT